ncbi:MAG: glycosyltransferase family 2 protein [Bacteroidales bacterium]
MAQVSIIIPVYNVSQYLDRCLSSVVNQTFKDIEIIVVNDGSTDDSPKILQKYAEADSRVKIVNKLNEGLAMARFSGLEKATAPYVFHLDGDDYVENNLIETVYAKILEADADLLMFRFFFEYDDHTTQSNPYPNVVYSNIEMLKTLWIGEGYFSVWSHIHKRSLYKNVHVDKELSYGEDAYLSSQLIYFANKVYAYNSEPLLHYVIRNTSISNSSLSESKVKDLLLFPELIRSFMKDKPEYNDVQKELCCVKIGSFNLITQRGWMSGIKSRAIEYFDMLKRYPDLIRYPRIKAYRKLNYLFTKSHILGLIYVMYYKRKGKIY